MLKILEMSVWGATFGAETDARAIGKLPQSACEDHENHPRSFQILTLGD